MINEKSETRKKSKKKNEKRRECAIDSNTGATTNEMRINARKTQRGGEVNRNDRRNQKKKDGESHRRKYKMEH